MISENLLETEAKLIGFAHKPVRGRLADALLSLSNYFNNNGIQETISLTRYELVNMIGTASETVVRMLSEFKEEKLIVLERKGIKMLDERGLARATEMYN